MGDTDWIWSDLNQVQDGVAKYNVCDCTVCCTLGTVYTRISDISMPYFQDQTGRSA